MRVHGGRVGAKSNPLSSILLATSLVLGSSLASAGDARAQPTPTPAPPGNIILIVSDDYAWPYYGFMQRWLRTQIDATGGYSSAYENDPNVAAAYGKFKYGYLLPDDDDLATVPDEHPDTPPIHEFLTPALDRLAESGNSVFYPVAHLGASICKPGLATLMTGLDVASLNRTNAGGAVTSPVIAEFLAGFEWNNASPKQPAPVPTPYFLSMGAGKWRYAPDVHSFEDDLSECPGGEPWCESPTEIKRPFDRELTVGADSAGTRKILDGRLEKIKDFIDCARCDDAGACAQPGGDAFEDDSPRMPASSECQQRPFFIVYNPLMPHEPLDDSICTDFELTTAHCQDTSYADGDPAWGTDSAYCDGGTPVTCEDFVERLELIGERLETCFDLGGDPGDDADNIYAGNCKSATCPSADTCPAPAACDCPSQQRKANYLTFISAFDRTIDELMVYLKYRGIDDDTMVVVITDNGASYLDMMNSKGKFGENGYRSPIVVYDPRSATSIPTGQNARTSLVQFQDVLATIRAAGPRYLGVPHTAPSPLPLPSGGVAPVGHDISPDATGPFHLCDADDLTGLGLTGTGSGGAVQCLFGRDTAGSSPQSTQPGNGWYVLAEVEDGEGVAHLCKFYHENANGDRLFDLTCDPNEQVDLTPTNATLVGSCPDFSGDVNYCRDKEIELHCLLRRESEDRGWIAGTAWDGATDPCTQLPT